MIHKFLIWLYYNKKWCKFFLSCGESISAWNGKQMESLFVTYQKRGAKGSNRLILNKKIKKKNYNQDLFLLWSRFLKNISMDLKCPLPHQIKVWLSPCVAPIQYLIIDSKSGGGPWGPELGFLRPRAAAHSDNLAK